jgi:hypothetical protein
MKEQHQKGGMDEGKIRFMRLETQVVDISISVDILMVTLEKKKIDQVISKKLELMRNQNIMKSRGKRRKNRSSKRELQ